MKYYFDESGNTGCLTSKGVVSQFDSNDQAYFVSGAVCFSDEADKEKLFEKYKMMKDRHGISDKAEIKGSDLYTRRYNAVLNDFIDNILDDTHFRVCLYDKRFYLVTGIMTAILGPEASIIDPETYYIEADTLSLAEPGLFDIYANYSENPNRKNSKKLIDAVLDPWLSDLPKESPLKKYARHIKEEWLFEILVDSNAPIDFYVDPSYQNLINVGAFCELLMMIHIFEEIPFENMSVVHDNNMEFAKEYRNAASIMRCNFEFADSLESLGVQIADNVSSLFFKATKKAVASFRQRREWTPESEWDLKLAARLLSKVGIHNIKFTVPLHDQAMLLSIVQMFSSDYPKELRWNYVFNDIYEQNINEAIAAAKYNTELIKGPGKKSPFSKHFNEQ